MAIGAAERMGSVEPRESAREQELPLEAQSFEDIPNEGTPAEAGAGNWDKPTPPENRVSQDVVLNIPESGLFGVLDGAGGHGGGDIASRESAIAAYNHLGPELDATIALAKEFGHSQEIIDELILDALAQAVSEADERVVKATGGGRTTFSVAKQIDGRVYLLNLGDSRILRRSQKGHIESLTIDDSMLGQMVTSGTLTKEQFHAIDQAASKQELEDALAELDDGVASSVRFGLFQGNIVYNSIGGLGEKVSEHLDWSQRNKKDPQYSTITEFARSRAQVMDLNAGDRLIFASDGVLEPLRYKDIESAMVRSSSNEEAERNIQAAASGVTDGHRRKKYDDDKGVVVTEAYQPPESNETELDNDDAKQFSVLEMRQGQYDRSAQVTDRARERLAAIEGSASAVDVMQARVDVANAELVQADKAIELFEERQASNKRELKKLQEQQDPLILPGLEVRYVLEDEGGDIDFRGKVTGFDEETQKYNINVELLGTQEVDRFKLEAQQPFLTSVHGHELYPAHLTVEHRGKVRSVSAGYQQTEHGISKAIYQYTDEQGSVVRFEHDSSGHGQAMSEHFKRQAERGAELTTQIALFDDELATLKLRQERAADQLRNEENNLEAAKEGDRQQARERAEQAATTALATSGEAASSGAHISDKAKQRAEGLQPGVGNVQKMQAVQGPGSGGRKKRTFMDWIRGLPS